MYNSKSNAIQKKRKDEDLESFGDIHAGPELVHGDIAGMKCKS